MPNNSWLDSESESEFDPISSLLGDWTDPEDEEEEFRDDFFQGLAGRRRKAAFAFMAIWGTVIALHLVSWGFWLVAGITGLLAIHFLRLIFVRPQSVPKPLPEAALATAPTVSLLVSAKNEEAVIARLARILCQLDYPRDRYEVWFIDDYSTDRTPEILDNLAAEYPQLNVLHRPSGAGGGKSGALNQALRLTKGDIIAVFDADAVVKPDLLRRVVPMFAKKKVGAVQVRKAIANDSYNFLTKSQKAEMASDTYFQQQRIASGGIGELRGNGQFVRRTALRSCGGWNEETITDDLDLTIRLHLDRWDIGFCVCPAVYEEGVTQTKALWHQRSRWAEGGYQRYLDYWRAIAHNRMGFFKTVDLLAFLLMQYILPTAAIPDLLMALLRHQLPILGPLTILLVSLALMSLLVGSYRIQRAEGDRLTASRLWAMLTESLRGILYLQHWLAIMPATTARMSVRPKRLKWVKTAHQGATEEQFGIG